MDREWTGGVVDEVRDRATARLEEHIDRVADRIGGLSGAMLEVGRRLREDDDHALAQWADRAAERVERFSGDLRGKDLDELLYEGERFARRQPALFLGGAFALGLLAARFLKSSDPRDVRRADGRDHDGPTAYPPRLRRLPRYDGPGAGGSSTASAG
jgi:hypothetical protein